MRENQVDQTTFIVHAGTGTIIDAAEVTLVNIDTTGFLVDEDVLEIAAYEGTTLNNLYLVLVGNPFDGYTPVGPFLNIDEAQMWGDRHAAGDWWTAKITTPYEVTQ